MNQFIITIIILFVSFTFLLLRRRRRRRTTTWQIFHFFCHVKFVMKNCVKIRLQIAPLILRRSFVRAATRRATKERKKRQLIKHERTYN